MTFRAAYARATGVITTVNSTIWSLSEALSTLRLVIAMVGSVTLVAGWLIVDAHPVASINRRLAGRGKGRASTTPRQS